MSASESRCAGFVGFAANTDTELLLSEYVDGELGAAEVALVEAHVAGCPACASELAFLRATNFVMTYRTPDVYPPADLFARVAQMTYARPTWKQRVARILSPTPVRWGLGTALAAGILTAVVLPQMLRPQTVVSDAGTTVKELATNSTTTPNSTPNSTSDGAKSGMTGEFASVPAQPQHDIATEIQRATNTTLQTASAPSNTVVRPSAAETAMLRRKAGAQVRPFGAPSSSPATNPLLSAANVAQPRNGMNTEQDRLKALGALHIDLHRGALATNVSRGARLDDRALKVGIHDLAAPKSHSAENADGGGATPGDSVAVSHVSKTPTEVATVDTMPVRNGDSAVGQVANSADTGATPTPAPFHLSLRGAGVSQPVGSRSLPQAVSALSAKRDQPLPGSLGLDF